MGKIKNKKEKDNFNALNNMLMRRYWLNGEITEDEYYEFKENYI